jgi:predicted nucleotide-binding protein
MMENTEEILIQAIRKVLNIVNSILNDNFVISENNKVWINSISREMEEKVNMLVYFGLQSGKMPIQRNSSIRYEEMISIQNLYVNIITKQPFEMKHFGKMVKEKLEKYLDLVGESYNEDILSKKNIFVIHGHDTELLGLVKEYIRTLGLNPVTLDEEMCVAQPIIEYLKEFLDKNKVSHAVSLLTFDEVGYIKNDPSQKRPRARINAYAETLMAIKELGNKNVTIIKEKELDLGKDFSDLQGLYYVNYDKNTSSLYWKRKVEEIVY